MSQKYFMLPNENQCKEMAEFIANQTRYDYHWLLTRSVYSLMNIYFKEKEKYEMHLAVICIQPTKRELPLFINMDGDIYIKNDSGEYSLV